MEKYNLSAEHIVKLLYRKEINRVNITDTTSFLTIQFCQKFFLIILQIKIIIK